MRVRWLSQRLLCVLYKVCVSVAVGSGHAAVTAADTAVRVAGVSCRHLACPDLCLTLLRLCRQGALVMFAVGCTPKLTRTSLCGTPHCGLSACEACV